MTKKRNAEIFSAVIGGEKLDDVGSRYGISGCRARQLVWKIKRQMMNPSRLSEDILPENHDHLDDLRAEQEFWLRQLAKWVLY